MTNLVDIAIRFCEIEEIVYDQNQVIDIVNAIHDVNNNRLLKNSFIEITFSKEEIDSKLSNGSLKYAFGIEEIPEILSAFKLTKEDQPEKTGIELLYERLFPKEAIEYNSGMFPWILHTYDYGNAYVAGELEVIDFEGTSFIIHDKPCGNNGCKSVRFSITIKQTRSADEGLTTIEKCIKCGFVYKK